MTSVVFGSERPFTEGEKLTEAAVVELTVNVATPAGEEVAVAGEIVTPVGKFAVSATALPETGFELESLTVTVIVDVAEPFAVSEATDEEILLVEEFTRPAAILISALEQAEVSPEAEA